MDVLQEAGTRIENQRRQQKATRLETYRSAVEATAAGKELTGPQIAKLADTLDRLDLEREHFENDVKVSRHIIASTASLENFDARQAALEEKCRQLTSDIEATQVRLREMEIERDGAESGMRELARERGQLNQFRATNPRLFGALDNDESFTNRETALTTADIERFQRCGM